MLARANKNNQININYYIPSMEQIQERIKDRQKEGTENDSILSIPELMDEKEFYFALKIWNQYYSHYYKLQEDDLKQYMKNGKIDNDIFKNLGSTRVERTLKLTAQDFGISTDNVLIFRKKLDNYYAPDWGSEVIKM